MGHLGFMLMFDDFFGFRVLIALSSELPQGRQNGQNGPNGQNGNLKQP